MSKLSVNFKSILVQQGLLGAITGTQIVKGIDGEDRLLAQWRANAKRFINRDRKVTVEMRVERLTFNESRCWPVLTLPKA